MNAIILDCDDVLLQFMPGIEDSARMAGLDPCPKGPGSFDLSAWLGLSREDTGRLIRQFIEDEESVFGQLPPIDGALEGVRALKEAGFELYVLSSFSDQLGPLRRRTDNLDRLFGAGTFKDIMGLALGSSKLEALKRMNPSIFVDDLLRNACEGVAAGHEVLWMKAHHTLHDFHTTPTPQGVIKVETWEDIIDQVMKDQPVAERIPMI